MNTLIQSEIQEHLILAQKMTTLTAEIQKAGEMLIQALNNSKKILFAGNGGSAADAQHLAAELVGRFKIERTALPAIALTTDTSILTAVANDYGYETVFARQLSALGSKGIRRSGWTKNQK